MLLLLIALPLASLLAVRPSGRPSPLAERIVLGIALYETVLLALGLGLGLLGRLEVVAYATGVAAITGVLAALAWRRGLGRREFATRRARAWLRTRRGLVAAGLVGGTAVVFAIQIGMTLVHGTQHWDGLFYHLPRMMMWIEQGSFEPWATPVWHQLGIPVGGDVVLGAPVLLGLGWRGIAFVPSLLTIGAIASVYLAALDFGLKRWGALLAAVAFASFPAVGSRAAEVNTDIAAAFPLLAAFVLLNRIREPVHAVSVWAILNGVAFASKPTIAPFLLVVGVAGVWLRWAKFRAVRRWRLPAGAAVVSVLLVIGSFWPVYRAFDDFFGGTYGRSLKVGSVEGFARAVVVNAVHWALEPLGYVPRALREPISPTIAAAYESLGVVFSGGQSREAWLPIPVPESGRSGLLAVLALPWLAAVGSRPVRKIGVPILLVAFAFMSGFVYIQPWSSRFTVVLLAGYALLWASAVPFQRPGRRRVLLPALVALNIAAALVVAGYMGFRHGPESRPGGFFHYLSREQRAMIARALDGSAMWVVTPGTLDALLVGPEVAFPLRYLVCDPTATWSEQFRKASASSRWLTIVHSSRTDVRTGPAFERPGQSTCGTTPLQDLRQALQMAGWRRWTTSTKLDVWSIGPDTHEQMR